MPKMPKFYNRKLENSRFPQFRNFGLFQVVLGRFAIFGVVLGLSTGFSSFWLAWGFSKYACLEASYTKSASCLV